MEKKDYRNIVIILIIGLIFMLGLSGSDFLYGSKLDWIDQNFTIAEYARTMFYDTKNLMPNFDLNLGLGQNMFNFVYYGFLNPIILVSYLLPFIKMVDYVMTVSIIGVLLSTFLFYKWIRNHYDTKIATISSILFITAGPLMFHSHRHLMFVNYMPFLIMALMGVDRYFDKKKSGLLIISIFLMIMTSYYFSVGGIAAVALYGMFTYVLKNKKLKLKKTIISMLKLLVPILIGVLMAAIIIIPTFYIILNSRNDINSSINLINLFIPKIEASNLLYGTYGVGLTGIIVFALSSAYFNKKHAFKFLTIALTLIAFIPLFLFILNGGDYVRAKALIPFLPLFVLLVSEFLETTINKRRKIYYPLLLVILTSIIFLIAGYRNNIYYIEILAILIAIGIFYKNKKLKYIFVIPIIIFSLVNAFIQNKNDNLASIDLYNKTYDETVLNMIKDTLKNDKEFYRFNNLNEPLHTINYVHSKNYYQTSIYSSTNNQNYNEFYFDVLRNPVTYRNSIIIPNTTNVISETILGVKYKVTKDEPTLGSTLIVSKNGFNLYKNETVFSLGYATSNLYSKEYFDMLPYQRKQELLLKGIIAEKDINNEPTFKGETTYLNGAFDTELNIENNKLILNEKTKTVYTLDEPINGTLLLQISLKSDQSCMSGDLSITINGIKNILTCREWIYHNNNFEFEYVISSNEPIKELTFEFSKGTFEINKTEAYIIPNDDIINAKNNFDQMIVDNNKTKGDNIYGSIDVKEDGYMALTIPYDKGFTIKVDGKKVPYEKVNAGLIGFEVTKGSHEIEISYKTPYLTLGKNISLLGVGLFLGTIFVEKKKK